MTKDRISTEAALQKAVENCSKDPIHIPGFIQGFGALIACTKNMQEITHASANSKAVLGVDMGGILGASPHVVLTREEVHEARNRMGYPSIETQREVLGSRVINGTEVQISLHAQNDRAIVEFIPEQSPGAERVRMFEQARSFLTVHLDEGDLNGFLQDAAERMRAMNRYDRVQVYRFLPDYSGEVVAESRLPEMPSYLGLRFPETDIPAIARALYAKTPFRVLHDIAAPNSALHRHENEAPLDMSLAVLRGLDPVHQRYLQNMGVGGSLSVSVVVDGRLWGLFACHNRVSKPVDPSMLLAAELSGRLISLRMQNAIDTKRRDAKRRAMEVANRLLSLDGTPSAISKCWQQSQKDLRSIMACEGVAFRMGQRITAFGDAPQEPALKALFLLAEADGQKLFFADDLPMRLPQVSWGQTAGAMALSIGCDTGVQVAFLRNLAEHELHWAGAPEKDVVIDDGGIRLDPRNSFKTYIERVQGRSIEWTDVDIEAGGALLDAYQEVFALLKKISVGRQTLTHTMRGLNHRLRNTLALVTSVAAHSRDSATSFEAYTKNFEKRIKALVGAHDLLTRADMEGAQLRDIIKLACEVFSTPEGCVTTDGAEVAIASDVVPVVALLIHELMSNAVRHGALSVSAGRVTVSWKMKRGGLELTWQEDGGPKPLPPEQTGFGRSIIEEAVPYDLNGTSKLDFAPGGVSAEIWLPEQCLIKGNVAPMVEPVNQDSPPYSLVDRGLKGLVVEDDFVIAKVTEQMLISEGFALVDRAATVTDALECLEQMRYDLCLLDVNLRGEYSLPVAQKLDDQGVPFVFTTGYGSDGHEVVMRFDVPTLVKPVDANKLRKTLARLSL